MPELMMTIGAIARLATQRLGETVGEHRVRYIIEHRQIEPQQKVGNLRAFSPASADAIIAELRTIRRRRRPRRRR